MSRCASARASDLGGGWESKFVLWRSGEGHVEGASQNPGWASWLVLGREEAVRGVREGEQSRFGAGERVASVSVSGGVQLRVGRSAVWSRAFACIGGGRSSWPDVHSFYVYVRDSRPRSRLGAAPLFRRAVVWVRPLWECAYGAVVGGWWTISWCALPVAGVWVPGLLRAVVNTPIRSGPSRGYLSKPEKSARGSRGSPLLFT